MKYFDEDNGSYRNHVEGVKRNFKIKKRRTVRRLFHMEGLVGFEPTIRELQSHALPLGYRPICYVFNFIQIVNKSQ